MANELDPVEQNWYIHLDKGQEFQVVAVDGERELVEIQHFDGDLEEVSFDEWADMDIEICEEPQNWSGPVDVVEADDLGTEITDTSKDDWSEDMKEFHNAAPNKVVP